MLYNSNKKKGVEMATKKFQFHAISNTPYIEGMREIRKSNASGTHADKRQKRARTRQASKSRTIKDWLD
jgi:hypothetical protein